MEANLGTQAWVTSEANLSAMKLAIDIVKDARVHFLSPTAERDTLLTTAPAHTAPPLTIKAIYCIM
jgi:hypothetical protein